MSELGMSADLHPVLVNPHKQRKVFSLRIGKHRFGYTKDPGEAALFTAVTYETRLRAVVRECLGGRVIEDRDLGSGLVTNVGVLALAYDSQLLKVGEAKKSFNLFPNLAYHQWGSKGSPAAKVEDVKLGTPVKNKNTLSEKKAVKDSSHTVVASGEGKPKFVSTSKLEAESTVGIEEWGIFTGAAWNAAASEELEVAHGTAEKFESVGTNSGKIAAANEFTESTESAQGERLKIALATESEETWLLITENTKREIKGITGNTWYKQSSGVFKEPTGTSLFKVRPVMFDHRTFSVINVESGNVIEFPWELEIKSGG